MSKSFFSSAVGTVQKAAKSVFGHTDNKTKTGLNVKLNGELDEMAANAFASSRELHAVYQDGLNYAFGNQWHNRKLKGGFEHVVANYIFPAMMQELAILSQRHSTIAALPWEPGDKAGADVWQGYFRHLYKREWKMKDFMLRAALDGKIYGHFVAYVTWEPRKQWDHANNRWQGGPVLKLVSPEFFGSDPEIDTIDEGQYIVTRRRIPTAKAKLIWPGYDEAIDKSAGSEDNHRDWFMPSSLRLSSLNFEDSTAPKATDSYSLVSQRRMVDLITGARGKQRSSTLDAPGRWITVEQFLFKDWTLEKRKRTELVPREELLESGVIRQGDESDMGLDFMTKDGSLLAADNHPKRTIETEVPNFPTYRHVVRLGETILNNDIKKQVWPYRHQPFIVGVNQLLPHVWFGLNSVEMPRTMQDMTNTAMSHILDYVKSMSDPTWKVEEGALSRGDTIKAGAGNVIYFKKNMMNRAQREDPPNMSAGTKAAFEMSVRETQNQTGVHEVAQGRQAKGRATATEMTMLQTNTRLRMALSNALLDAATIRIFETVGEIAQRRLPVGEMIRIVGEKHASTVSQISEEMQFTRYDLEMTVTTAMPYDKEKRRMDAKDLFAMVGMPALKELTDAYDDIIDDPEDFLGRVDAFNELILLKERAEAEATAALQQQQQQPQQATTEPQPQQ